MKPIQKNSIFLAGALIFNLACTLPAFAVNGVWSNPTLPSTTTLTSNVAPGTEADLVWTGNPFDFGDAVFLTGTVPGGFTPNTQYYVVSDVGDMIQLSATLGGPSIPATTAISNGTAQASYQLWQSTASWTGGTIPEGTDAVATFSNDFTAPNVVGVGVNGSTLVGVINFTDTAAPASGLVLTAGILSFDAASPQINITQPTTGTSPLTFAGTGPIQLTIISPTGLTVAVSGSTAQSLFGTGVNWTGLQGPLSLSSGNYHTAAANVLPVGSGSSIFLGAGVEFQALQDATRNQSIRGLSGNGSLGTNDSAAAVGTLTVGTGTFDTDVFTYSGVLGGDILTPGLPNSNFNLTKTGASTQILSGANLYTGTTSITGGILKVANPSALGGTTSGTDVNGGTLDLFGNSIALGGEPLVLTGTGLNGVGALINSSLTPVNIAPTITNGNRQFAVGGTGDITFGTITGGGGLKLTKVGSNTVAISNAADNAFFTTQVDAGTLVLATQPSGAKATDNITVNSGGTVRLGSAGGTQQQIGNGSQLLLDGILDLNGFSESIGGFTSTGSTGLVTNGGGTAATFTIGNNNPNTLYAGVIANGVSAIDLVKLGTGSQTLSGINTYTGATTVTAGSLLVNGSTSSASAVTVAAGATLGGSGTVGGPAAVNGSITPGNNAIGTLTFGSTLAINATSPTSSNLNIQLGNWLGTAGTGFDTISAQSLAITTDAVNKLVVNVDATGLAGFSESNKSFILASTTGGVTGLASDNWQIVVTGTTAPTGTWALAIVGNNLVLNYTLGSGAPPGQWDGEGTDNLWSNGPNWAPNIPPVAGNFLNFQGSARLTPNNDLAADTSYVGIKFAAGAGAFTLSGNSITLGTPTVAYSIGNESTTAQIISFPITTATQRTVLLTAGGGNLTLNGVFSGTGGGIASTGAGTLFLNAANTYTGATTIGIGTTVVPGVPSALGDPAGALTITSGSLNLNGMNVTKNAYTGSAAGSTITNGGATPSIITLGNNDGAINIQGTAVSGAVRLVINGIGAWSATTGGLNTHTDGTWFQNNGTVPRRINNGTGTVLGTGSLVFNGGGNIQQSTTGLNVTNPVVINGTGNTWEYNTTTTGGAWTGSGTLSTFQQFSNGMNVDADLTGFSGTWNSQVNGTTGNNNTTLSFRNTTATVAASASAAFTQSARATGNTGTITIQWSGAGSRTLAFGDLRTSGAPAGAFSAGTTRIQNNTAGTTATYQVGALGLSSTYGGNIINGAGTVAIEKVGVGTWTLGGTNTYTGTTTVTGGKLSVTGSLAVGSAVTVASTGSLGGTGSVAGTISSSGTIAPGTGIGTLTTGAAIQSGILAVEANASTADLWAINGTVNLTGSSLIVTDLATVPIGTVRTIATYTAGGRIGTLTNLSPSYTIAYDQGPGGNEIRITKVPEAGYASWAMTSGLTTGVNDGGMMDPDFDGIANVLEYVLGSTNPINQSTTAILPKVSTTATHLVFDFKRRDGSLTDTTQIIQTSTGLGTWTDFITLGAASAGPVEITDDGPLEDVRVSIPLSNAVNGKLFARLWVTKP